MDSTETAGQAFADRAPLQIELQARVIGGSQHVYQGSRIVIPIVGLFIVFYALITFVAWGQRHLRFKHVAMAAAASIVPFGPFVIDRVLKRHEEATAKPAAPEEAW